MDFLSIEVTLILLHIMSPVEGKRQSRGGKTQDGGVKVEVQGTRKTDPHAARESARTVKAAAAKGDKEMCTRDLFI